MSTTQDPFAQGSEQYSFEGDIHLDANNSFIAEVLPSGTLRIFESSSRFDPLKVLRDPVTGFERPPVIHVSPETRDAYPSRYRVSINGGNYTLVNAPADEIPFSSIYYNIRLISSGVWSPEGTSFFVVWMDGMISKAVVHPPVRVSAW